jgi:beta-N-acetylhexosaminidase
VLAATFAAVAVLAGGAAQTSDGVEGLSTRQLAGQRTIEALPGRTAPRGLLGRIRRGEVAGVILFSRNIGSKRQVRALVRRLQREPRPKAVDVPLLVMVDQEGGLVKRLPGAPTRSPAQVGATGSAALARRTGAATARNLRSYLATVNLAPVMDIGRPGTYQRRTGRAYGGSARTVGRIGSAFVAGLEAGGVASSLKHFPGLGTVSRDEDLVIQRVPSSLATLRKVDEAPFRAGIRAGARLVMTSTARYTALDRRRPALLSRKITTGELRRRLGFDGVIVTDDLDVPALRAYGRPETLGPAAAGAGNDLLLFCGGGSSGPRGAAAVARGLRAGKLDRGETLASVRRVLALRRGLR